MFRTYDFRHSHASLLIDQGANVLAVAERMGHADPAITLRVYGHLFEGVQEQLTAKLEATRQAAEQAPQEGQIVGLNKRRREAQ
jgi:integrase